MQLKHYLTELRALLKDAQAQFWSDGDLIRYVNKGIAKTVAKTAPLRQLISVTLVAQQETYSLPTISVDPGSGAQTLQSFDVANISVLIGTLRQPLRNLAWTEFNRDLRPFSTYYSWPAAWAIMGQKTVYLGPIPDQAYVSEWDAFVPAPALKNPSDDDGLIFPFDTPVVYYAAYLAQLQRQRRDIAADMLRVFQGEVGETDDETQFQRGG